MNLQNFRDIAVILVLFLFIIYLVVSKLSKGISLPFNIENELKARKIDTMVKVVLDEKLLLRLFLNKMLQENPDMLIVI